MLRKIEDSYDKNQGCLEKKKLSLCTTKIKVTEKKLNKVQQKPRLIRKKLKQSYDKNRGYQEKLNLDIKKKNQDRREKLKIVIKN